VGGAALRWLLLWIGACGVGLFPMPVRAQDSPPPAAPSRVIYVARRGWHIDIGVAQADLEPPLNSLAAEFPGVRYLFFGFGDQQYLVAKNHTAPVLLGALWPGRGMLLVTGLSTLPEEAFGAAQVAAVNVTREQMHAAQSFIWNSLDRQAGSHPSARGPYDGSLYFAAAPRYSAFHTCNTWAAEALEAAALPIHSAGVIFAGQLWSQVRRLTSCKAASCRPGKRQSFPNSGARPPSCSSPAAGDCCC
jgi:hypothetical protein